MWPSRSGIPFRDSAKCFRVQGTGVPPMLSVKDKKQSASWSGLFGAPVTQNGVGNKMSPTRRAELKRAMRAAAAAASLGLSRGRGGSTGGGLPQVNGPQGESEDV